MKIALVVPPVEDFYFTPQRASFLGVRTIETLLSRQGADYRLFNGVRPRGKPIPLPVELDYLKPFLGQPLFFKNYHRFGITHEHLAQEVRDYGPDRVLVSSIAYCYATEAARTIKAIKSVLPGVTVYAGGPGPTVHPRYYIENGGADFAVRGEVDHILHDLLNSPERCSAVYGAEIVYPDGPSSPVDTFIPVLARTGLHRGTEFYSTMISRGCPRRCSYCSVRSVFPTFRHAPIAIIKEEIARICGSSVDIHVNFEDDNPTWDFDFFLEVLRLYKTAIKGRFSFSMENGVDFTTLDEEKVTILKHHGLKQLNLSLVTLDNDVLGRLSRRSDTGRLARIIEAARRHSVPVTVYVIAGLPGEGAESIARAMDFLDRMGVLVGFSAFYPVPGTGGYEDLSLFDTRSPLLCRGSSFFGWNGCSTAELVSLFTRARALNLSRPRNSA